MALWERFYRECRRAAPVAVEPLAQFSAYFFTAFGKNNCSPPIL